MSSRRLLPSPWYDLGLGFPGFLAGDEGKVLTISPGYGGRAHRSIPLGRFSFDPHLSLFHWAKTQSEKLVWLECGLSKSLIDNDRNRYKEADTETYIYIY